MVRQRNWLLELPGGGAGISVALAMLILVVRDSFDRGLAERSKKYLESRKRISHIW